MTETHRGGVVGQKVHPIGFRLGINKTWQSNWYAKRNYADLLHEDLMIRCHIKTRLYHAGISKVEIERAANRAKINIYTARPGIIIGKRGAEVDKLKNELQDLTQKQVAINIKESARQKLMGSWWLKILRSNLSGVWPFGGL
jgi:small subunit ribosomal protein S3